LQIDVEVKCFLLNFYIIDTKPMFVASTSHCEVYVLLLQSIIFFSHLKFSIVVIFMEHFIFETMVVRVIIEPNFGTPNRYL
jgi:hypothetical protein